MRQPEIVTDYNRIQLHAPVARVAVILIALGLIFHCLPLLELGAICLPFSLQISAPWWTKRLLCAFFVPCVFMGLLAVLFDGQHESGLSTLFLSMYYLGAPAGFVCLLFVSAWLAVIAAGKSMCSCLRRLR